MTSKVVELPHERPFKTLLENCVHPTQESYEQTYPSYLAHTELWLLKTACLVCRNKSVVKEGTSDYLFVID